MRTIETENEASEYYRRHCSIYGGVVVAFHIKDDGGVDVLGIFSTLEKAHEWVDEHVDEGDLLFSPYVVDEPEFGNIPSKELN